MHLEGHDVRAVALDESGDRVLAVTFAQEGEEIAAVEVVAVQRKAAALGVHLAKRAQAARHFGAHHPLVVAVAETAVAARGFGLVVDREAFEDPRGLQQVGKERQQPAEHVAQRERRAGCLVEMHDMEELVAEHELEPLAVLQELALVGRRKKNAGEVEGQGRGEAVGEVRRVHEDEMRLPAGPPVEKRRNARINSLRGCGREPGLRAVLLGEMHQEMLGFERPPAQLRVDPVELLPLRAQRAAPQKEESAEHCRPDRHSGVIAACASRY